MTINARDYGAIPDDGSDDCHHTNAIEAAKSLGGGEFSSKMASRLSNKRTYSMPLTA